MDIALIVSLSITLFCFTGIWLINVITKDAGVIDYYWGPGFAVIASVHLVLHGTGSVYEWVLFAAATFWALRLAAHLIRRHHGASAEDGRYLAMREAGGRSFWWTSLFKIFILQAVLLWMIASPLQVAFGADIAVSATLFWFGISVYVVGLTIEWVADNQLAAGKLSAGNNQTSRSIFTGGLWRKSRHPNYFGEILLWWGLAIAAFAMSGAMLSFVGPSLLTLIIIGVSIPLTEQHMLRTRSDYGHYMATVPMVLPFWLKSNNKPQPAE